MVGQVVLIANVSDDIVKDLRKFGLKARLVKAAAGQAGEGLHFIVGLQVVDLTDGNTRVPCGACPCQWFTSQYSRSIQPILIGKMVTSWVVLTFLVIWSRCELAEGVNPSADQNDVFVSLDLIHPVEGVIERVKQIGLGKTRDAQLIQTRP